MDRYECHKIVEAARIEASEQEELHGGETVRHLVVRNADNTTERIEVSLSVFVRMQGMATAANESLLDGYLVRYSDDYLSWSPAQPFEDGYSLITESLEA